MRRLLHLAILVFAVSAVAQHVGENAPQRSGDLPVFSSTSQMVVETVSVTDKKGNPITGLAAKDFTVTENGAPQNIRVFEYQNLGTDPLPPVVDFDKVKVYEKLSKTQITAESEGKTRYRDRRLLALYFDMTSMPPADQVRALTAADKFIRTQMTAADLVSIMRYSGGSVEVLQDFTSDRERLLSIITTLTVGEGQGYGESADDSSSPDTGAAFGQDDSEFNIFNTDRQLSALQTAAQMLGRVSEKKSLIYFASGLQLNGLNNQAQLRATVNSAIRAGVTFWSVDARGLVAMPPMGDATEGSPGNAAMYSGVAMTSMTNRFQQSQDTLYSLAEDTGGKALLDSNDLSRGIVDAERAVSSYYIIGYYTTNTEQDGRFRRIKISLNSNDDAKLDYRQGYFAGKHFEKFTLAEKERQLEDALMLPDPITDLTIAMEVDYFQLNRAEYFVPIVVKIPGRELALAKRGGAERTQLDFIGEIKDSFGSTISNVRDKITAKLSDATAAELAKRPIIYDTGFTLLPGKYTIKFLARDDETGRIGTYQATFVVPNLNKEEKRVPISSVVLSSQRVDLKDALYAAKDKTGATALNPLVDNGSKLLPSVTRVFRRDREMLVYLQAYTGQTDNVAHPVVGYVTLLKGTRKVLETKPIQASVVSSAHSRPVPMSFSVPLANLDPGRYQCQVTVLDPQSGKATFWRSDLAIIQ